MVFQNENILKLIFGTFALLTLNFVSADIKNSLLVKIIHRKLDFEKLFKSLKITQHIHRKSWKQSLNSIQNSNSTTIHLKNDLQIIKIDHNLLFISCAEGEDDIISGIKLNNNQVIISNGFEIQKWNIQKKNKIKIPAPKGYYEFGNLILLSNGNIVCTAKFNFGYCILIFDSSNEYICFKVLNSTSWITSFFHFV
jgi:hypothetical protein